MKGKTAVFVFITVGSGFGGSGWTTCSTTVWVTTFGDLSFCNLPNLYPNFNPTESILSLDLSFINLSLIFTFVLSYIASNDTGPNSVPIPIPV